MNANRVPGLGSPDSNKPVDRQIQREAAQRVEKVGEVDPDEQARQQRFKQIMQSGAEDDVDDAPNLPSPFDLSSARQGSPSDFGMDEIPNSSYSQPPSLSPSASPDTLSDKDLPQSSQFWRKADLPDQPTSKPKYEEKTSKKGAAAGRHGEKEVSILGPPGKPSGKTTREEKSVGSKKKGTEEGIPTAKYWAPDSEPSSATTKGTKTSSAKGPAENVLSAAAEEESSKELAAKRRKTPSSEFEPVLKKARQEEVERQRKDREQKKKEEVHIVAPSLPELPAMIQPAAVAATQAVAGYLRPEAMPLFYQMIGSIMVMSTPPGISRTEFTLNNPAFANSKFFGATIELIKYSTAPDSYNIRLSGSNEAVAAFNQNLPGLMAAFQTSHFSFRIGRIDAEYTVDRPVLRRKESTENSGRESKQDKR